MLGSGDLQGGRQGVRIGALPVMTPDEVRVRAEAWVWAIATCLLCFGLGWGAHWVYVHP
jgi:hypothetical protein